ncbi:MAG: ATP synthase F0 subunit B [Myxococcales bacterium]|nr:ATP synthase F0 subunit B [Myxococcales bacterium]
MTGHTLLLLANDRPLINIDITLVLNLGLWVLLFVFLRMTFWKPMLAVIEAREEGTEGAREAATGLDGEIKRLKTDLDAKTKDARVVAARLRDELVAEGQRREAELLAKVRAEVSASVDAQRATIASQKANTRTELLAGVPALARDIASKVLRREVQS